jgi:hypothetical protein
MKAILELVYNRRFQSLTARLDKRTGISIFPRDLNLQYVTNIFRHAYRELQRKTD